MLHLVMAFLLFPKDTKRIELELETLKDPVMRSDVQQKLVRGYEQ